MPDDDTRVPDDASTDFVVRELRHGDGAAVRSLVLAGLAEHWGSVDPSLNPDLDDLASAYPGSRTLVAVDPDGTIVGTGTLVPRGDGVAEVVRMSVTTRLRGTGVGRLVLDALTAVALARGVERMVLETTASWTATVAFYERCGLRLTHYADGDFGRDAWFERRLAPPSPETMSPETAASSRHDRRGWSRGANQCSVEVAARQDLVATVDVVDMVDRIVDEVAGEAVDGELGTIGAQPGTSPLCGAHVLEP